MSKLTRRSFVTSVGAAIPATVLMQPPAEAAAAPANKASVASPRLKPTYLFFDADEALFIEAACERLIPADELGPGAIDAGVPNYLDKQLGGAWGAGERLYRSGPWRLGTPSQGYQLPYTPAELFHASLRAINRDLEAPRTPFSAMSADDQDALPEILGDGRT